VLLHLKLHSNLTIVLELSEEEARRLTAVLLMSNSSGQNEVFAENLRVEICKLLNIDP
jgi:hypothetical protein